MKFLIIRCLFVTTVSPQEGATMPKDITLVWKHDLEQTFGNGTCASSSVSPGPRGKYFIFFLHDVIKNHFLSKKQYQKNGDSSFNKILSAHRILRSITSLGERRGLLVGDVYFALCWWKSKNDVWWDANYHVCHNEENLWPLSDS